MIYVKRLSEDAVVPSYAHAYDAGFDLYAAEDVIIEPGETKLISTGIAIDIPAGYEIQVRPRSGITRKTKLRVQLGTIDSGYRGDIGIIVDNIEFPTYDLDEWSDYLEFSVESDITVRTIDGETQRMNRYLPTGTYLIRKGDKIAQAVLAPIAHTTFKEVEEFEGETARGANGFGSTGVKK